MDMECSVPPGFRFRPTEEELVGYYLERKINSLKFDLDVITDIDLYKIEPWDIQEKCKLRYEEQTEWYFFSHKDRKYPTGTRTNRATAAGFWKATGRDKAIVCKNKIIGMRKTLVFYKGRAPNGTKSDWIMHEYRLQTSEHSPSQEEGWVVCRAFKKPIPNQRPPPFEPWINHPNYHPNYPINHFRPNFSHSHNPNQITTSTFQQPLFAYEPDTNQLIDLPKLESPTNISTSLATSNKTLTNGDYDEEIPHSKAHFIDWKNLDNLLGSQHVNDSFSIPNLPSIPQTYDLDTYDTHCFPDSQQQ